MTRGTEMTKFPFENFVIIFASHFSTFPSAIVRKAMMQVKRPWRRRANWTPMPAMSGSDLMHGSACDISDVVDLFSIAHATVCSNVGAGPSRERAVVDNGTKVG